MEKLDIENEADKFENYKLEFCKKIGMEKEKCEGTKIKRVSGVSYPEPYIFKTKKAERQVDCVAVYQDTIFIIECKYTRNKDGKYSGINKEIHDHHDRKQQFENALRDTSLRKKNKFDEKGWDKNANVIGVFALKNVVLSDSEKYEMERKGFKVWDNDFFAYYEDLEEKINKYAIFDMLGELDIQNNDSEPVMSLALQTETKIKGKNLAVYQFFL